MKLNRNSDPREVFEEMHKDIAEVKKGLGEGVYSKEEIKEIKDDFLQIEFQALKIKISLLLDAFAEKQPELPTKEVLVKVFQALPEYTSESLLPKLADYVFQNWKPLSQNIAA